MAIVGQSWYDKILSMLVWQTFVSIGKAEVYQCLMAAVGQYPYDRNWSMLACQKRLKVGMAIVGSCWHGNSKSLWPQS